MRRETRQAGDGELCARQKFAGQLILLDDLDLSLDGLIGCVQLRGLLGNDSSIHLHQIINIAGGFTCFLHQITAFTQGRRLGNTLFIGGHGASQPRSVFVVVVDLELNPGDGMAIQAVFLGQLNPALFRFIFHINHIGLSIGIGLDSGGKMAVHISVRNTGLFHLILAPVQPAGFCNAACIRRDGESITHTCAASGCGSRKPCDGKDYSHQRFTGQLIRLSDLDPGSDQIVGKGSRRSLPIGYRNIL